MANIGIIASSIYKNPMGGYTLVWKANGGRIDWNLGLASGGGSTLYKVLREDTGEVISEGITHINSILFEQNLDMSTYSGVILQVWYKLDNFGNGLTTFGFWYGKSDIIWADLRSSIFPLLNYINGYEPTPVTFEMTGSAIVANLWSGGADVWNGVQLDPIGATSINCNIITPPYDLTNNTELTKLVTKEATFTNFEAGTFSKLITLNIKDSSYFSTKINNIDMPDLRSLTQYIDLGLSIDLTVLDLSKLTYLKLYCDTFTGLATMPNLVTLYLKSMNDTSVETIENLIDLTSLTLECHNLVLFELGFNLLKIKNIVLRYNKNLEFIDISSAGPTLTAFQTQYGMVWCGFIDIKNGFNNSITVCKNLYGSNDNTMVRVDNASDATDGTAPYDKWEFINVTYIEEELSRVKFLESGNTLATLTGSVELYLSNGYRVATYVAGTATLPTAALQPNTEYWLILILASIVENVVDAGNINIYLSNVPVVSLSVADFNTGGKKRIKVTSSSVITEDTLKIEFNANIKGNITYIKLIEVVIALGPEIVIGGDMNDSADFTLGTGWQVTSGSGYSDGSVGNLTQTIAATTGDTFRVAFETRNGTYSANGLEVDLSNGVKSKVTSDGVHSFDIVAGAGAPDIKFWVSTLNDFIGEVDNITVRKII